MFESGMELEPLDTLAHDLGADFNAWAIKCDLQCMKQGADARVRVPARVLRALLGELAAVSGQAFDVGEELIAANDRIAYLEKLLAELSA